MTTPRVSDELVQHALRVYTEPGFISDEMRMRAALEVALAYLARTTQTLVSATK